jgi:hypothetical protein
MNPMEHRSRIRGDWDQVVSIWCTCSPSEPIHDFDDLEDAADQPSVETINEVWNEHLHSVPGGPTVP